MTVTALFFCRNLGHFCGLVTKSHGLPRELSILREGAVSVHHALGVN